MMLPILYRSKNRKYFYTIEGFDQEQVEKALSYSAIDFALESVTFVTMLIMLHLTAEIRVMPVFVGYVKKRGTFEAAIAVTFPIMVGSFTFFIKHFGCDPTLQFDNLTGGFNSTSETR